MATRAENLDSAIDNVCRQLKDLTDNPKPSYSLDGESYSWSEHWAMLNRQLIDLEKSRQRADGPFEARTTGI